MTNQAYLIDWPSRSYPTRVEPELTLDEMLADPIVHMIFARDGLDANDVEQFLKTQARRFRRGLCRANAPATQTPAAIAWMNSAA